MVPRSTKTLTAASLLGLAALAPNAPAQWDSIPFKPDNPVHDEGFLVAHDDDTALQAFSALTQGFLAIAGTGAIVHGSGDWTVLAQEDQTFVGYSARVHDVASLTVAANFVVHEIRVEDDVALVVGEVPAGFEAHAYSAQTNSWATLALGSFADVASTRFAVALREGGALHGFAARTGAWAVFAGGMVAPPVAEGNVITYERVVMGDRRQIAFSGVLGIWSLSPILMPATAIGTAHNTAFGFERLGMNMVAPTAYSAYTGAWITSPFASLPADVIQSLIDDNVVVVERNVAPHWEAIGARPQLWAPNFDQNAVLEELRETLVLLADGNDLFAFGGLSGAAWVTEPYVAPLVHRSSSEKHIVVHDGTDDLHAFSPAVNAWAPVANISLPTWHEGDAITAVETVVDRWVYSARNNVWSFGPAKALLAHVEGMGDSVFASQLAGAIAIAPVQVFNERENAWNGPLDTGGDVATWYGGRNLLIADTTLAGGELYGYSVQRGDLVDSPSGLTTPLSEGPKVEENVAWAVDAAGDLYAFGSPLDTHAWYAWPNGSEYQSPSPPGGPSINHRISIEGDPGALAWIVYGLNPDFAGLVIPGVGGALHLQLPTLFTLFLGALPADGLFELVLPLPPTVPPGIDIWNQALYWSLGPGVSWSGPAPEPAFLF